MERNSDKRGEQIERRGERRQKMQSSVEGWGGEREEGDKKWGGHRGEDMSSAFPWPTLSSACSIKSAIEPPPTPPPCREFPDQQRSRRYSLSELHCAAPLCTLATTPPQQHRVNTVMTSHLKHKHLLSSKQYWQTKPADTPTVWTDWSAHTKLSSQKASPDFPVSAYN